MNTSKLEIDAKLSCYKELTSINEKKKIIIVESKIDNKIYVKKEVSTHSYEIYRSLMEYPVLGAVKIYDLILLPDKLIVIEEYVTGKLLSDLIVDNPISEDKACNYFIKICETVKQLHNMNPPVIHRDIKASNIIITSHDEPVLLDFNIAKLEDKTEESDTELLGSIGYAAPEQYGFGPSTTQADIYALGILFNAMLQKGKVTRVLLKDSKHSKIIKKCTNMNPAERYRSIDELLFSIKNNNADILPIRKFPSIRNIPGFRHGNKKNMVIASMYYIFAITIIISFFINVYKDDNSLYDSIGMTFLLFECIIIPIIFILNYRNIWSIIPFMNSKIILFRIIACIIAYFSLSFILIGALLLLMSPISH